jgi:hypothetical protein
MTIQLSIAQLANDIREIHASDRLQAEALVETYLEKKMNELSGRERMRLLKELAFIFNREDSDTTSGTNLREEVFSQLFWLLLGRKVSQVDLSSPELLERLAESLNTIFDTLNKLVSVINGSLFGEHAGEETIRKVLCFELEREKEGKSLDSYLGQISKAFLIAQQAFKKAAYTRVKEILFEMDPCRIASVSGGGLRLGPLRKAESFEIYEERYNKVKKWFESGRFMEELLREFEKNCQELSTK